MRILHLPGNAAGLARGLVEGERALGHHSSVLSLVPPRFGFPVDRQVSLDGKGRLGRWWALASALARVAGRHDLYNFNFGGSLLHFPERGLPYLDLPFYGASAKKVFTWQGCDARQRDATLARGRARAGAAAVSACLRPDCGAGFCDARQDSLRRRSIAAAARHADHMFAVNPDLLDVLPEGHSSFLPYAVAGYHGIVPKAGPFCPDGVVHIVHAPSDPVCKGTDHVLAAVDALREEMGARLRFTLVSGVSYQEARRICAGADLFIDQMLVGWYGGVSVEVMRMGIPTIAYINPDHLARVPAAFAAELPVIAAEPGQLLGTLRRLITDQDGLAELGARGRAFTDRWHAPERVAGHVLSVLSGQASPLPW